MHQIVFVRMFALLFIICALLAGIYMSSIHPKTQTGRAVFVSVSGGIA